MAASNLYFVPLPKGIRPRADSLPVLMELLSLDLDHRAFLTLAG